MKPVFDKIKGSNNQYVWLTDGSWNSEVEASLDYIGSRLMYLGVDIQDVIDDARYMKQEIKDMKKLIHHLINKLDNEEVKLNFKYAKL